MAIEHITDHYERAVARLPMVYRDKPRYLAWLAAYCTKIQNIEDVMWEIYTNRLIQNEPTGDLLAKLGILVGQLNLTGVDAEFRLLIQARILASRSNGRRNALVRVTQALWPLTNPPVVWVFDMVPATVMIFPQAPLQIDPYIMFNDFLSRAVGAGIRLIFTWTLVPIASTLILGDSGGGFTPGAGQLLSDSGGAFDGGLLPGTV
jgi:hypothetical protein